MTIALKSFGRDGKRRLMPGVKNDGFNYSKEKALHYGFLTGEWMIQDFGVTTDLKPAYFKAKGIVTGITVLIYEN